MPKNSGVACSWWFLRNLNQKAWQIFYEFGIIVKLIYDQSRNFFFKGLTNYLRGALNGYMFEPTFDALNPRLVLDFPEKLSAPSASPKRLPAPSQTGRAFAIFI
jgi:hypothetical protein